MDLIALHDAKNRLTRIVREVEQGKTIELTRHGKPVAVLIGIEEYTRLKKAGDTYLQDLNRFYDRWGHDESGQDPFDGIRDTGPGRETVL